MTTAKPYHGTPSHVSFGRPTVGPKVYLVRGPSGWPEQFTRKLADKALETFLAPLDALDVLAAFAAAMRLEGRPETWEDVLDHLAKVTDTTKKLVPNAVGVAFWGRYLIVQAAEGAN